MVEHAGHRGAARAFSFIAALSALLLGGCAITRDTQPPRTATEEMLISAAADRAAEALRPHFAPGAKVFVDSQYFDGTDAKYTIGAIRDRLAQNGARLVADRKSADMVVEIRSGAQSIDQSSLLIGLPSIEVPIPLAGQVKTPEIALFKRAKETGVSKVAATGYGEKDGVYAMTLGPEYGFSHQTDWTVLLFISWKTQDFLPENADK
jgi:Family of unknown function (DUF6655)